MEKNEIVRFVYDLVSKFGWIWSGLPPVISIMAIRVVKFSSGGYKIRKILAQESTYPKEIIEF